MKKFQFLLYGIIISIFFILYSCDSNPSGTADYPPSCVKGYITDSATHKPVAGVRVFSIPGTTDCLSDTAGYYFLKDIPMSSSGTIVYIIAYRGDNKYLSDTAGRFIFMDDTIDINFVLVPSNGVYYANNITLEEYVNSNSNSSLDMGYMRVVPQSYPYRDIDLRDSAGARTKFQFRSSGYENMYQTKFGSSLGNFSKYDFDTLQRIYGAGDPLESNFYYDTTNYFSTPLKELHVYPFYLKGRTEQNQSPVKFYGLLYIKSAYIDPGSSLFTVIVDVKVNRNGQNYFIPNSK
jgi:hypothetical protein